MNEQRKVAAICKWLALVPCNINDDPTLQGKAAQRSRRMTILRRVFSLPPYSITPGCYTLLKHGRIIIWASTVSDCGDVLLFRAPLKEMSALRGADRVIMSGTKRVTSHKV